MAEAWERNWRLTLPLGRLVGRVVFKLEVRGRAFVPQGPVILAANHLSHVDPPFVGAAIGRPIRFMAAADLLGLNAGLDAAIPFFGAIPLPRVGVPLSAMKQALGHLSSGGSVGVFPEGRRTAYWGESAAKEGGAWLALRAGVPLVPVAVVGTGAVMSLDANFPRPGRVTVAFGPPLEPVGSRRDLTLRWWDAMSRLIEDFGAPSA